jgi:hypothetical protein
MSFSILAQSIHDHTEGEARLVEAYRVKDGVVLVCIVGARYRNPKRVSASGIDAIDALAAMLAECARWECAR